VAFAGINTWRGVTRHKPILTGKSYMRVGSIKTGKMVIYPIVDNIDAAGRQLVNWMAEIEGAARGHERLEHVAARWTISSPSLPTGSLTGSTCPP
jgi:hypothetical protein